MNYNHIMLKGSKRKKPPEIYISEDVWRQMMQHIRDGVFRKLNVVRKMQSFDIDIDIAAGIYVYAVDEFGNCSY